MRAVLDANVGVKWFLAEADSPQALKLRDGFLAGAHDWIAPDIYPLEVAHSLTKAQRQGRITVAEAASLIQDAMTLLPALEPHLPLLPSAVALALRYRLAINDCLYLALAEREGIPFVTADQKLLGGVALPLIVPFASLA